MLDENNKSRYINIKRTNEWSERTFLGFSELQDLLDRGLLLTRTLVNLGFLLVKLKSSLRKFYGPHHDLIDRYGISVLNTSPFFLIHDLSPICNYINTTGATSGAGTAYLFGSPDITSDLVGFALLDL